MTTTRSLIVLISLLVAVSACRKLNDEYCAAHPEDTECPPPGQPCTTDNDCGGSTPICKGGEVCVECLMDQHCTGDRPICNLGTNTCGDCNSNADCDSALCAAGSCAAPAEVAYVDAMGDDARDCSQGAPCATLKRAIDLTPRRKYIKATGRLDDPAGVDIDGKTAAIFGDPGSTLITRTSAVLGPVIQIRKAATVSLTDLEIVGEFSNGNGVELKEVDGTMEPAVTMTRVTVRKAKAVGALVLTGKLTMNDSKVFDNDGIGVQVMGGAVESNGSSIYMNRGAAGVQTHAPASLVMKDSQVAQNLIGVNALGGTVTIEHSWIYSNTGNTGIFSMNPIILTIESSVVSGNTGLIGGMDIAGTFTIKNNIITGNGSPVVTMFGMRLNSAAGTFEFNTVSDNVTGGTPDLGITCGAPFTMSNNIITGNITNGCTSTWSLYDGPVLPGTDNKLGDPLFIKTTGPLDPDFYRIRVDSDAKDSANPTATEAKDIDGQARSGRRDMGADEFVAP